MSTVSRFLRFFERTKAPPLKIASAKIAKVPRVPQPARSYDQRAIATARAIMPAHYLNTIRQIGLSDSDEFSISWIRALTIALVSQDFDPLYDEFLQDERIGDTDRDIVVSAILDAQAAQIEAI